MTKEQLKNAIIKKFGSMSNFARCSGLHRYDDLQLPFGRKEIDKAHKKKIEDAYRATEKADSLGINKEKLDLLIAKIQEGGGVYQFCKYNPEFKESAVSQLVRGERTRKSKFVKKIFDHFGIK